MQVYISLYGYVKRVLTNFYIVFLTLHIKKTRGVKSSFEMLRCICLLLGVWGMRGSHLAVLGGGGYGVTPI